MNLEVGQYIFDGESKLLVCDIGKYQEKKYVYLLDEDNDIGSFYEINKVNEKWEFKREKSPALVKQLIIHFSDIKDILKKGEE